jgi:hypothetical protein
VIVEKVLQLLDDERKALHIASYDVLGTSIEDIFLDLMASQTRSASPDVTEKILGDVLPVLPDMIEAPSTPGGLDLTDGRPRSPFSQALTIFHKRALIARRSWLTPLLVVLIAVCGSCIPTVFLSGQSPTCITTFKNETVIPLYFPDSPIYLQAAAMPGSQILTSPPNITTTLGKSTMSLNTENIPSNATFISMIQRNYLNLSFGGISIDTQTGNSLFAWQASPPSLIGPTMMNLVTNILYNRALNVSGDTAGTPSIIFAHYASFPRVAGWTLTDLKWVAFFGAAMVRAVQ